MKSYDTILFDLDGTITNPRLGITNSILYALKKLNIQEDNPQRLIDFIGPPLPDSFKKYYELDDAGARTAVATFREYYSTKGIYEVSIFPGMKELLKNLHEKRRMLVLATSKPTVFAKKILQHFDCDRYFYDIVGSNYDLTMIAKDEILSHALRKIGQFDTNKTVMIGDRADDIIAAHANQIGSIAVTYGFGSLEEINQSKPTYIAHSVEELSNLLQ